MSKPEVRGRLRVRNVGSEVVVDLTIRFPQDTLSFGDVHPGETTEYQDAPHGVFRYGVFDYTRDGRRMHQGVVDFIGERPQAGNFTYRVRFAPIELGRNLTRNLLTVEKVVQED